MFTPENAATVLTAHDEAHEFTEPERWAWASVGAAEDLPVVEIALTPILETSTGSSPDRDNVERFHAWVLPGAHNPGRFIVEGVSVMWLVCDPCGAQIARVDGGKPLDDLLAAVSAHECTAVEAAS